jgi:hypothetical protein
MTGPIEEGGKIVGGFIEAMKTQPLSLALVVMNIALILLFYFILATVAEQRRREVQLFYDEAKSVREMLADDHHRVMELMVKCHVSEGVPK